MHRFNFDRSHVLAKIQKLPGGRVRLWTYVTGMGPYTLRTNAVTTCAKRDHDSSHCLVDFGSRVTKGKKPVAAVIVGLKDHLHDSIEPML